MFLNKNKIHGRYGRERMNTFKKICTNILNKYALFEIKHFMSIILHNSCSLRLFKTYLCKRKLHIMCRMSSHARVKFSNVLRILLYCVEI